MKENQASFTALMVAYMRAYHSMHETPKIFDDFLAYDLIPEEKRSLIEQYLTPWDKQVNDPEGKESCFNQKMISEFLIQGINNVASHARYSDDNLEKAIKQGVKQYVILGARMDTFAFRRPEMLEKLEVFEVDHPATQEFKLHRLVELGWKHPAKLHFIPIGFTKESLVTALTNSSSYDPEVKSFFSWLGVINFLSRDDAFATLRSITEIAPAGSMIIFDYLDTDAFVPEKMSPHIRELKEFLQKIDEPIIASFNPSTFGEELANLGFRLHENLSPQDIKECYMKGYMDGYHVQENGHFACAVVE
jgi:methyltransferase (TIGR00027 family)